MRTVKIAMASREFTKVQKIALQNTSECISLDAELEKLAKEGKQLLISPKDYVILDITTDKPNLSGNENYKNMIVIDRNGTRYATGSNSFMEAFINIFEIMHEDEEDPQYDIVVERKDSKNYKGKYFLTCNIVA